MPIPGPVSYERTKISGSKFHDVDLSKSLFDDVNLSKTVFRNVALTDSTIENANLTNLRIENARLDGMTIEGVLVSDLLRAYRASGDGLNKFHVTEIKAFVPARNFDISKQFYKHIGFTMASEGGGVAYFHFETVSFLLQDFCAESSAVNFMMHMLVKDVEAWWNRINESGVTKTYGVTLSDIELQPWRMRDFCLTDPTGVLWRIGQNI